MRKLISTLSLATLVFGSILLFSIEADAQKNGGNRRSGTALGKVGSSSKKSLGNSEAPTAIQCAPSGTIIVGGSTISGSLGSGDCQFEDGTYFDLYTLTGNAGDRVTVSMTSAAVDSYLILFNAAGDILLEDDDGLGAPNARLPFEQGVVVLPYTGTYYVGANSYGVASGAYQLAATLPSECATNTSISPGSSISSALNTSDCRTSLDGTLFYTKFYTFSGTTGQQLSFSMTATSGNIDPYLVLRTPSGAGTVEDDAGGGGTAARIPAGTGFITLPETGTYILEASSAGESETGGFTLGIGQNCAFSLSPSSPQSFGTAGGTGSIAVTTEQLCSWTAQSNSGWITITSGSSGTGNGTVNFSVSSNTGTARSGAITAGGITLTINQDAAPVGSIAGTVRYYFGQTPVAVPGVNLSAMGSVNVSGTTNANGIFDLQNFGSGAYTLTPTKSGQVAGISSLDASRVAQHSAQLITLTSGQLAAADVTNNGSVNSLDASRIAQWVVGIPPSSGQNVTGTWKFSPSSRSYTSVTEALSGQDFTAILMGDVTGNWVPPASVTNQNSGDGVVMGSREESISQPSAPFFKGPAIKSQWSRAKEHKLQDNEVIDVPITISNANEIFSYDALITFDPSKIEPLFENAVEVLGTLSSNLNLVVNASESGRLRLAAYGVTPIFGEGVLLTLKFKVKSNGDPQLSFPMFFINDEEVMVPGILRGGPRKDAERP